MDENDIRQCRRCGLCETRCNVVIGRGNPSAPVWFIGEAPGEQEDIQGLPFVGASGRELDAAIAATGLRDFYISNVVLCRPIDSRSRNRAPTDEEKKSCEPNRQYLRDTYRPRFVITLGKHAAEAVLGEVFSRYETGVLWDFGSYVVFVMLHPAAVLYNPGLRDKWNDDVRKLEVALREQGLLPSQNLL
jgi:DNA polymerase